MEVGEFVFQHDGSKDVLIGMLLRYNLDGTMDILMNGTVKGGTFRVPLSNPEGTLEICQQGEWINETA